MDSGVEKMAALSKVGMAHVPQAKIEEAKSEGRENPASSEE
jgi:hypothetical protein